MAKIFITELDRVPVQTGSGTTMQIARLPPVAEQAIEIGVASAQSALFNAATRFVCLTAKADCHISLGTNPTATNLLKPFMSGQDYYFGVEQGHKLAVIATS